MEVHADGESHHDDGDGEGHDKRQIGSHQSEQQWETTYRRDHESVEVAVLDVGHERRRSRHTGDGEDDRDRELEGLEADMGGGVGDVGEGADVEDVEEDRDDQRRDDSLGFARDLADRTAGHRSHVDEESRRARLDAQRRGGSGGGGDHQAHAPSAADRAALSSASSSGRSGDRPVSSADSSPWRWEPVSWRKTSSSVGVRRVRLTTAVPAS